jgi:hypothetical protein
MTRHLQAWAVAKRRRHDRTIREANGDRCPGDAVAGCGGLDEVGQDRSTGRNVGFVDCSIREAVEKRISAVDGDGSPGASSSANGTRSRPPTPETVMAVRSTFLHLERAAGVSCGSSATTMMAPLDKPTATCASARLWAAAAAWTKAA